MKIKINHISKTEGHSGFEGVLLDGNVTQAKIEVQEGARLIEGLLIGRPYTDAPVITARVCGICPVIHNLVSIKALERALNIKVSNEVVIFRKIMLLAQIIQSHALHLFFMTLPDFIGIKNGLDLIKKKPKQTQWALDIRKFATELIKIIGGRAVHPINSEVGGFKRPINQMEFKGPVKTQPQILVAALKLARFFARLKYPKFERQTNFVSLYSPRQYAIYDGDIRLSQGKKFPPKEFINYLQAEEREMVKHQGYLGRPYMVGALARINNNQAELNAEAKKFWISLRLGRPVYNSFYNVMAQAVEIIHCLEEIKKLSTFLGKRVIPPRPAWPGGMLAGEGLAAAEAPRGTLFHYYKLNENGIIKEANIITPTAQFLNNLEEDLKAYIPKVKLDRNAKIKQMIRAYDPCFTCATQ